ncbi:hypothetical protein NDU88_006057 [Pleurodeles waltl]|uniref:Uncharacterized protein n=1 Tax=Pleurodeles waltl TaxID=8319 RepID=A0AAV7SNH4_PLEWA|nr:hypothetical protein NDU88_006057 [Pleurodeles waltl]
MPPAASGRELPVGAATCGSLCPPPLRCKFRLGFLGLRARTDSITLLHLSFLLMRPYGSPLPPCISLGCRIVEIASGMPLLLRMLYRGSPVLGLSLMGVSGLVDG